MEWLNGEQVQEAVMESTAHVDGPLVDVIEGLMKAGQSSVQADAVHSDTQLQSTTVFASTHLLGIHLMPQIRNWKELVATAVILQNTVDMAGL